MDRDDGTKFEWYTLPGRLMTVAAMAFVYAYWDRLPEKGVVLVMFAAFFVLPLIAVEIALHHYLRKRRLRKKN